MPLAFGLDADVEDGVFGRGRLAEDGRLLDLGDVEAQMVEGIDDPGELAGKVTYADAQHGAAAALVEVGGGNLLHGADVDVAATENENDGRVWCRTYHPLE